MNFATKIFSCPASNLYKNSQNLVTFLILRGVLSKPSEKDPPEFGPEGCVYAIFDVVAPKSQRQRQNLRVFSVQFFSGF